MAKKKKKEVIKQTIKTIIIETPMDLEVFDSFPKVIKNKEEEE